MAYSQPLAMGGYATVTPSDNNAAYGGNIGSPIEVKLDYEYYSNDMREEKIPERGNGDEIHGPLIIPE